MKQTILATSCLTILLSSGCSILPTVDYTSPPPVQIMTEDVKLDIYQPPLPQEISMQDVTRFVINKENYQEAVQKVESLIGGDFVVIALTPTGYESMAYNLQEIRRFIRQQKEIILYYRAATDAADDAAAAEGGARGSNRRNRGRWGSRGRKRGRERGQGPDRWGSGVAAVGWDPDLQADLGDHSQGREGSQLSSGGGVPACMPAL